MSKKIENETTKKIAAILEGITGAKTIFSKQDNGLEVIFTVWKKSLGIERKGKGISKNDEAIIEGHVLQTVMSISRNLREEADRIEQEAIKFFNKKEG